MTKMRALCRTDRASPSESIGRFVIYRTRIERKMSICRVLQTKRRLSHRLFDFILAKTIHEFFTNKRMQARRFAYSCSIRGRLVSISSFRFSRNHLFQRHLQRLRQRGLSKTCRRCLTRVVITETIAETRVTMIGHLRRHVRVLTKLLHIEISVTGVARKNPKHCNFGFFIFVLRPGNHPEFLAAQERFLSRQATHGISNFPHIHARGYCETE